MSGLAKSRIGVCIYVFLLLCVLLASFLFLFYGTGKMRGKGLREATRAASAEKEEVFVGFVGEQILYDVKLGKLTVGRAQFNHRQKIQADGREMNLMTFHTQLVRFNDLEKIYSDTRSFLPLKVERDISIWPRQERITESYNQENFTLTVVKHKGKNSKELLIKKDGVIHNAILLPYYVRAIPSLDIGWAMPVRLPTQEFVVKLVSIEDVTVPAGTYKSYHFESEPKRFEIWITADQRRIPVKLTGTGSVGYTMVMKDYRL